MVCDVCHTDAQIIKGMVQMSGLFYQMIGELFYTAKQVGYPSCENRLKLRPGGCEMAKTWISHPTRKVVRIHFERSQQYYYCYT